MGQTKDTPREAGVRMIAVSPSATVTPTGSVTFSQASTQSQSPSSASKPGATAWISRYQIGLEPQMLWVIDETDPWGAVSDLQNVAIRSGHFFFYGLDAATASSVQQKMQAYKHYISGQQQYDSLANRLHFENQPLDPSLCNEVIEETAFVLSPWHTNNVYHLHNDNLVALFANMRQAGAVHEKKVLFQYPGDPVLNAKAVPFIDILSRMFDGNLRPFSDLEKDQLVCFRRLRWGRGPLMWITKGIPAMVEDGTLFSGLMLDFVHFVWELYGLAPKVVRDHSKPPKLVYFARDNNNPTDSRRILHDDKMVEVFKRNGVEVIPCCNWKEPIAETIARCASADGVIGPFGANIHYAMYLPPGGFLVEFMGAYGSNSPLFLRFCGLFGHAHFFEFVKKYQGNGFDFPDEYVDDLAKRVLSLWLNGTAFDAAVADAGRRAAASTWGKFGDPEIDRLVA